MVHDFLLLHRQGSERFRLPDLEITSSQAKLQPFSFKTCMRAIVVGDADSLEPLVSQMGESDEVHQGSAAYRFLLQVICGLHSPLIGETEVYGQFKNAVTEFSEPSSQMSRFFRALFEDAKRVRQAHLLDCGSQSYGSVLRREIKGLTNVHIIGAGHLVQEILPWIAKDEVTLHLHCRNVGKTAAALGTLGLTVQLHQLNDKKMDLAEAQVLIVGAPVSSAWLKNQIGKRGPKLQIVADLRGESDIDPFAMPRIRNLNLHQIFAMVAGNQTLLEERKQRALAAIELAVANRERAIEYRPFGWDDVS